VPLPRPLERASRPSPALTGAVREAARFDRRLISPAAGLLAAIPVVLVLGGGIAAGDSVAAVTMGAGAMLVGIAWRTGGGRPPLALMATDAVLMATSTFVGGVTGSTTWLHLTVLCVWSAMAGLLVALGRRGAIVGTQAIIALVVFGRFSQPVLPALGLAGLVLAGGLTQVVFLSAVRWPTPLRAQRIATAAAYRALARLATAPADTSTLPAASALDDAQEALSSPALFGDAAVATLRSLVNEGHRMRVQLTAIQALRAGRQDPAAERTLSQMAVALGLAAAAIEGDGRAAAALPARASEVSAAAALGRPSQLAQRLASLAGQLRAVATLAPSAGEGGGLRTRRPYRRTNRPLERLRGDLATVRDNASLHSPAGRHALRLAVIVPATALVSRELSLQRGYWMVVAAATVLRPEFGATFTRGAERALGTCLGVGLAGAIAVGLHPAGGATVVIVGLLAWAGYAVFPASFAVGFGFITAVVVFLLNVISPDTLATASARLLDTLVGGTLGLLAYAVWPTWARAAARQSLADLIAAQRAYVSRVLEVVIAGRRAPEAEIRRLSRGARLARTSAEATVARSLAEPETRRIDAEQSLGALGALRRLIQAAHVLRLDAQEDRERAPRPTLKPLAADIDRMLGNVAATLSSGTPDGAHVSAAPDLRSAYEAFERTCADREDCEPLLAQLDEIVDAANGLAELVGVDPAADEDARPTLGGVG
jgi:uncharacterized membrane protein YccC